ncbi:MAG: metallophosphoesterase family protein [Nanopusillaceae archaeon]
MRILVTSDLHLPYNIRDVIEQINAITEHIDIIILCGDIIDNREHIYLKKLYNLFIEKFGNVKIYSTFGNNEATFFPRDKELKNFYKKEYPQFNWLDYEYVDIGKYYLVGFEGFPDRMWKSNNYEELKKKYVEVLEKIFEELDKKIIVFSHYGLIKDTVLGDPSPLAMLYSKYIEDLIIKYSDKIVYGFHGHVHKAVNYKKKLGDAEIYNVAFPIHKKFLVFEI